MTGTLAKFFDDVAAGIGIGPGVERATVAEIHGGLAAELAEIADALPPGAAPIVLTKNRIRNVLACETGALASEAESTDMNAALMLGLLVDRLVATFVVTGAVPADAYATAVEAVRAERDERALTWLEAASPEDLDGLHEDLAERAERIRESWPAVEATWWPRLEDRVTLPFADGKVLLSGRFDLLTGGAPTPVERVIVEVKAGTATAVHQPDLYWYGLLGALRDHVAPPHGRGVVRCRRQDHHRANQRGKPRVGGDAGRRCGTTLDRAQPRAGAIVVAAPWVPVVSCALGLCDRPGVEPR